MLFSRMKSTMVEPEQALRGRDRSVLVNPTFHEIFGIPVQQVPTGSEVVYLALGCFWGAEKLYWKAPGVSNTAVGYQGGYTPNPSYEEVCSARTGHTEIVKVSYDPDKTSFEQLLKIFFENHDPTQGYRQGNDVGTQYRSAIYTTTPEQLATAERVRDEYQVQFTRAGYRQGNDVGTQYRSAIYTTTPEQLATAERVRDEYQVQFTRAGYRQITTEIKPAPDFYYAEDYHQQYLDKNPFGYCPVHATGVTCN